GQPACGNFKAYGFCKYGARCKFDHPVPIRVWICACSLPPSIPCVPVSICGAASSDCSSSVACGWVGIMVWICACSPPSLLPCPSSIPSVSVSICGAASSGCISSTNTHISCSNQTSENEKEDDGTRQKCKNTSSEAKKGGKDPSAADNSRERDTSDNAAWS
ncbi:BnaCnng30240D, partial [Brassica napus]